jgi:uncharacterized protein YbjQ (UPF0145 family)
MRRIQDSTGIYLLTSAAPENFEVVECFGLVTGESVVGANFMKDFFARIVDITGGRAGGYERALRGAMENAVKEMALDAQKRGANAIINLDIDTNAVGQMFMASCYGTAVELRQRKNKG